MIKLPKKYGSKIAIGSLIGLYEFTIFIASQSDGDYSRFMYWNLAMLYFIIGTVLIGLIWWGINAHIDNVKMVKKRKELVYGFEELKGYKPIENTSDEFNVGWDTALTYAINYAKHGKLMYPRKLRRNKNGQKH